MRKTLLAPLLLVMLTGTPVYAQISEEAINSLEVTDLKTDRDFNAEYLARFTENYFDTDLGMTRDDYARLQQAEGYVREGKLDKGLELLRLLREAYPEVMPIGILMAKAYLQMEKPEQALLILEDARKRLDPLEDTDQPQLFRIIRMEVRAYEDQKQSAHALRLLQNSQVKPKQLNEGDQEDYYLTLAKLLLMNNQPEEAYYHLQAILETGQRAERTRTAMGHWSPMLAEEIYKLGIGTFREGNYPRTQRLALISYSLNPEPVKYAKLLSLAQDEVRELVNEHFQNALPALANAIRNMRYALEQEDYNALHQEYMRLRDQEDVAFFMTRDYEGYLPTKMQYVLREVEDELRAHGFVL